MEKLESIIKQLERFERINKEDIPILIKEIRDLQASEKLACPQLEVNETLGER
jgi:hypothetical protein